MIWEPRRVREERRLAGLTKKLPGEVQFKEPSSVTKHFPDLF